eukprot:scaffold319926_cov13-Tisochrysis_lutea.AAC.1
MPSPKGSSSSLASPAAMRMSLTLAICSCCSCSAVCSTGTAAAASSSSCSHMSAAEVLKSAGRCEAEAGERWGVMAGASRGSHVRQGCVRQGQ